MRIIYLMFVIFFASISVYGEQIDLKCRYDFEIRHFKNGNEVRTTSYDELKRINPDEISTLSVRQVKNAIKIYENPDNKKLKMQFLNDFPSDFMTFVDIYHPHNLKELYPQSHTFLHLLDNISNEYPLESVKLLISLSKDGKWKADATGYLQRITTDFIIQNYQVFITEFKKLSSEEQKSLSKFIADFEAIAFDQDYESILELFQRNNEQKFYAMFLDSKHERMKQGH